MSETKTDTPQAPPDSPPETPIENRPHFWVTETQYRHGYDGRLLVEMHYFGAVPKNAPTPRFIARDQLTDEEMAEMNLPLQGNVPFQFPIGAADAGEAWKRWPAHRREAAPKVMQGVKEQYEAFQKQQHSKILTPDAPGFAAAPMNLGPNAPKMRA